jgi:hypothetical protein
VVVTVALAPSGVSVAPGGKLTGVQLYVRPSPSLSLLEAARTTVVPEATSTRGGAFPDGLVTSIKGAMGALFPIVTVTDALAESPFPSLTVRVNGYARPHPEQPAEQSFVTCTLAIRLSSEPSRKLTSPGAGLLQRYRKGWLLASTPS